MQNMFFIKIILRSFLPLAVEPWGLLAEISLLDGKGCPD